MSDIDDAILDAAIRWHLRQATLDEAGWAGFVDWLEADPAHARAYDAVSLADAARHPALPAAANDDGLRGRRMRRWGVGLGAIAAAAVGVIGLAELQRGGGMPAEIVATAPRMVALADGTRIAMEPGARMTVGARSAALEQGRAVFQVTHDAAHPFSVRVGEAEIRDLGTRFVVTRGERGVDVSVSEGAVLFISGNSRATLRAGEALTALAGQPAVRSHVEGDRARTLAFSGQPVRVVGDAIGLALGEAVRTDDSVAATPFTGIVRLTGDAPRDMARFAELTGMSVSHEREGWIIARPAR